jgi:hypothetical protein
VFSVASSAGKREKAKTVAFALSGAANHGTIDDGACLQALQLRL